MAALTTNQIVDAGTAPTFIQAGASDTAEIGNGHNTFVVYKNTTGSSVTITVVAPGNTDYGVAYPDPQISVPATNGERWIPLRNGYDDGTGRATLTTSAQDAGITVAVVRMQ